MYFHSSVFLSVCLISVFIFVYLKFRLSYLISQVRLVLIPSFTVVEIRYSQSINYKLNVLWIYVF